MIISDIRIIEDENANDNDDNNEFDTFLKD